MRKYLKRLIPQQVFQYLKRKKYEKEIGRENRYQNYQLLHFSNTFRDDNASALASLTVVSHVLEKGITMPERRLGFGYARVRDIIDRCRMVIREYGYDSIELQSSLADLKQYLEIHREGGYELPEDIDSGIQELVQYLRIDDENCWKTSKESYFGQTKDFADFAYSRHSIRWFAGTPVDDEKLMKAIRLSQTTPSACNRQATRVKIISSDEGKRLCCELQNGNRGFGDKADKWLLITSELGAWSHTNPHDPYLDGGMYAMNLLYALHYYGIVACTLNAHLTIAQREQLRAFVGYPESEVPVVFIVIGNPTDEFMVPKSRRLATDSIVQFA